MKRDCAHYTEALADLAEGRPSPNAQRHVEQCLECQRTLAQHKSILAAASLKTFRAPLALIQIAQAIFPTKVSRLAQLRCSLLGASSRSGKEAMQATFGNDSTSVSVVYQPTTGGWEIVGRAPNGYLWARVSEHTNSLDTDGYFAFSVKSLSEAGLTIGGPEGELYLPPVEVPVDGLGSD